MRKLHPAAQEITGQLGNGLERIPKEKIMTRIIPVSMALAVTAGAWSAGAQEGVAPRTLVYKTVGDVRIEADVYRVEDSQAQPVLVWIHGGALILGSRKGVPRPLSEFCRAEKVTLVSIDYRLAPEVLAEEIAGDVRDALRWVREQGPTLFRADPNRIAVAGGSAGGYLTMMSGLFEPRPTALVAFWGYGDVDGDWYAKPSEFYRKSPLVGREEALGTVGRGVLTATDNSRPEQANRGRYYVYLRQNGLWTREITGMERGDPGLNRLCPVRGVTPRYPPILMVHGTEDTDVPYEKSADMDRELAKQRVPHELVTVRGAGHGLAGASRDESAAAYARATAFLKERLRP